MASLAGPPMAGLDLQVQTDRYCIYQVWFCVLFHTRYPPQSQLEDVVLGVGAEGGKEPTPEAGVQERGTSGSFGKKEGVSKGGGGASLGWRAI